MKFRPLQDRVLLRPSRMTTRPRAASSFPDTVKEKPMEGEVIGGGPRCPQ